MKQERKTESIIAIIVSMIGLTLFTILLVQKEISAGYYVTLMGLLAAVSLAIHGFSRILKLDLKNLKITLDKIVEVRDEIFAKEEDLNNIAISLIKILACSTAWEGRLGSEETHMLLNQLYRLETRKLLDTIKVDKDIKKEVMKYHELFEKIEAEKDNEAERNKLLAEILDTIRADVKNADKSAV